MNLSQTLHTICNSTQVYTKFDKTICGKKCEKDCTQHYFLMSFDNKYYSLRTDSKIKIKYKLSQVFHYKSEIKITFLLFLSNIGGIIALWLGLSFIDSSAIITAIISHSKRISLTIKLIEMCKHIIHLTFSHLLMVFGQRINFLTICFKAIEWRNVLTIMTFPVLLYQIYELVDSYLQFSTEVSVDIISYRDSENNIRYNVLPAISVCNEIIIDELLSNNQTKQYLWQKLDENYFIKRKHFRPDFKHESKDPHFNKLKEYLFGTFDFNPYSMRAFTFFKKYLDVESFNEFLANIQSLKKKKISNDFNEIESEISEFYSIFNRLDIQTDALVENLIIESISFDSSFYMISPFGKCHSYLYKFYEKQKRDALAFYLSYELVLFSSFSNMKHDHSLFPLLSTKYLIHTNNSLPVLTNDELYFTDTCVTQPSSYNVKLRKYVFEKLQTPYDTNCQMYENSTHFQCLNECYFEKYRQKIECIPNYNSLLTIDLWRNESESNFTFCSEENSNFNEINSKIIKECDEKCLTPCYDTLFQSDYDEILGQYAINMKKFHLKESFYIKIIYTPHMTSMNLFIDVVNIWSFWHGVSFLQIVIILLTIIHGHLKRKIAVRIKLNIELKTKFKVRLKNINIHYIHPLL